MALLPVRRANTAFGPYLRGLSSLPSQRRLQEGLFAAGVLSLSARSNLLSSPPVGTPYPRCAKQRQRRILPPGANSVRSNASHHQEMAYESPFHDSCSILRRALGMAARPVRVA